MKTRNAVVLAVSLLFAVGCSADNEGPSNAEIKEILKDNAPMYLETINLKRVDGFWLDDGAYVVEVTGTNRFTMSYEEAVNRPYVPAYVKRRLLKNHGRFAEGETFQTRSRIAFVPTDDGWEVVQ